MARVSLEDVKRVGIALGWIVLYAVVGFAITIGIANLVPGWGGPRWYVFRNGAYEVTGFIVATVVVGKLLNKYSWDRMGWHTQPGGGGLGGPGGPDAAAVSRYWTRGAHGDARDRAGLRHRSRDGSAHG